MDKTASGEHMLQNVSAVMLVFCLLGCTHQPKSLPAEPLTQSQKPLSSEELKDAKTFITKAIYHEGSVWVLGLYLTLFRVDLDKKEVEVFPHARYVLDMYQNNDGELFLLTANEERSVLQIVTSSNGSWSVVATLPTKGLQGVLGLTQYKGKFLVLTKKRIYLQNVQSTWMEIPFKLNKEDEFGLRSQLPMVTTYDGYLYVGLNKGEWGGGLLRVSLEDGYTEKIHKVIGDEGCGAPLDSDCDPVTSLVRDPQNPNAVLVGVGLRHFFEHGRLLRVTKNEITVIFNKNYEIGVINEIGDIKPPVDPCSVQSEPETKPHADTEAVFEVERNGGEIWLVTGRAVYSLSGGVVKSCTKLPESIKCHDGICAEEKIPGVILVASGIGSVLAVGGTIPLIAIKK